MDQQDEIVRLRATVASYEKKSRKTRWLLKQLLKKIKYFPRDLSARLRNSRRKRRELAAISRVMTEAHVAVEGRAPSEREVAAPVARPPIFHVASELHGDLLGALERDPEARLALAKMEQFCGSAEMGALIASAAKIDPEIGALNGFEPAYLPFWYDREYHAFRQAVQRIPEGEFDAVVLVPFGKLGGADLVGGLLATTLSRQGRTLILRTDLSDWDRPDWYPDDAPAVDVSVDFSNISNRSRALYILLRKIAPRRIFNVNSRLAFDMFVEYGERLQLSSKLYAYYFCADRDAAGNEAGYPVWYFANILPYLTAAICDTESLVATFNQRYSLPASLSARVRTVYTPAMTPVRPDPLVRAQIANRHQRQRPRILWAGRLDRQKRFDLLVALARIMPDVQFDCWGKAVLDAPPDMSALPENLTMHGAFATYEELPLAEADGWLYTAEWDGLPTILIELATMGMPIVASAVGGVPELIDETTGWPVSPIEGLEGYERAVRNMLEDEVGRQVRAEALQKRVGSRHTSDAYFNAISEL